ncbi:major facilitator superfamily domain-containing protein [Endogone sp. FLAS-F59071]|nr:major facilitator superfamily domain-containing protein [Endogone sp. FLAS-F59071]|eukprot:RUS15013.1 major facilitator superfamily domain-containing protein [Endogone sp. FLAS-F59071]
MPIRSKKVLAAQLPSLSLVGAASAQGPPSADGDLPRVSNEKCRRWTIVGEPEVFFDFDPEAVRRMLRRVDARLIPLLFIIYLGCCVARVNIGNARIEMQSASFFGAEEYGWVLASIFFGYIFFEGPANILLQRVPPHQWLSLTTALWGLITLATGFAPDASTLTIARFFLGIAQGGVIPGIVCYLSLWYTREEQASRIAMILAATPLGNSVSGLIDLGVSSGLAGVGGLNGWSWNFILEGIFAILLSLCALLFLSRTPHHTNWLTPTDREILLARLEQDDEHRAFSMGAGENHFRDTVRDWKVWFYAAIAIMWGIPANGIALALPTVVLRMGVGVEVVQWMSAVPGIVATVISILIHISSNLFKERGLHVSFAGIMGVIGYLLLSIFWDQDSWNQYGGLIVAVTGVFSVLPTLISWVTVNIGGRIRRNIAMGIIFTASNIGGVVGAHLYQCEYFGDGFWVDADFQHPHIMSGVCMAVTVMLIVLFKALLVHENNRRERLSAEEYKREAAGHAHDDKHPSFRFTT